jgi:hypothetical protein
MFEAFILHLIGGFDEQGQKHFQTSRGDKLIG